MDRRTLHHDNPVGKAIFAPRSAIAFAVLFSTLAAFPVRAATLRVPQDFSTLAAALGAATAGDTVLVQSGIYAETLVMKSGVVLRGAVPSNRPIVDAQDTGVCLSATDCDASTRVEDFVFTDGVGLEFGGGMSLSESPMAIVRCRFVGNEALHGGAIGGDGAAFTLQDCEFDGNHAIQSGGAITITDLPSPTITGCRFVNNSALAGGAIAVRNGCTPTITGSVLERNFAEQGCAIWYDFFAGGTLQTCTIVSNEGLMAGSASVHFGGFSSTFVLNNIVAFGSGAGAFFFVPGSAPVLGCNDAFGNDGGDAIEGGTDLGTNFSLDPLFCDVVAGNYALQENSPCAPNGPCGLVGALGIGPCGATSADFNIEVSSWGAIKSLYR